MVLNPKTFGANVNIEVISLSDFADLQQDPKPGTTLRQVGSLQRGWVTLWRSDESSGDQPLFVVSSQDEQALRITNAG